jgi:hypothetical protein
VRVRLQNAWDRAALTLPALRPFAQAQEGPSLSFSRERGLARADR